MLATFDKHLESAVRENFPAAKIKNGKNLILVEVNTDCQENSLAAVREKLAKIGSFIWMT